MSTHTYLIDQMLNKRLFLPVIAVNCCINPFTPGAEVSPSAAILPPQTTTYMWRMRYDILFPLPPGAARAPSVAIGWRCIVGNVVQ